MTAFNGAVYHFEALIDSSIEFIFGACRTVAKKSARLRAGLWRKEQRDPRADQCAYKKSR
jgi:hypothetical protein